MQFLNTLIANIETRDIIHIVLQIILYVIGVFVNTEIVCSMLNAKKDNKSWQLHVFCSFFCIVFYIGEIPFGFLSNLVPDFPNYLGEWCSYLFSILCYFLFYNILLNPLMVATNNWFIATNLEMRDHERIQHICLAVSICTSLCIAVLSITIGSLDCNKDVFTTILPLVVFNMAEALLLHNMFKFAKR